MTHLDLVALPTSTPTQNPPLPSSETPLTRTLPANPQRFLNGEIHDWYRIVLGYSDHLVSRLLDEFEIRPGQLVLDPFCGTGTTLIECMKRQVDSVGIDANPSSVFAARVKTNWELRSERLLELLGDIASTKRKFLRQRSSFKQDPTYRYLDSSGMIKRGWISPEPLRKALALKNCIGALRTTRTYKDAFTLGLLAEIVGGASNIKFGPELYCGKPAKDDADVYGGFATRVQAIVKDLETVSAHPQGSAAVLEGDARNVPTVLADKAPGPYAAVICSPPYPAEHDYTRNSRLELAFLELVTDSLSLRRYKKQQVRSHTKGIYKDDADAANLGSSYPMIEQIAQEIATNARTKTHGFAKLYSTVVREYFGGMKRHLQSLVGLVAPGAKCAYVLGDQSAYVGVHIPTAQILASIAVDCGYEVLETRPWRTRRSSGTSKSITENILLLRRP